MTITERITQAAKRWVEAVALIGPAKSRWWDAVVAAYVPVSDPEGVFKSGGHVKRFNRVRKYVRRGGFGDGHVAIDVWTYTEHMGEIAGQDASKDPLCIELSESYHAKVKATRAAGSARGALLRMTRAAVKRGDL